MIRCIMGSQNIKSPCLWPWWPLGRGCGSAYKSSDEETSTSNPFAALFRVLYCLTAEAGWGLRCIQAEVEAFGGRRAGGGRPDGSTQTEAFEQDIIRPDVLEALLPVGVIDRSSTDSRSVCIACGQSEGPASSSALILVPCARCRSPISTAAKNPPTIAPIRLAIKGACNSSRASQPLLQFQHRPDVQTDSRRLDSTWCF